MIALSHRKWLVAAALAAALAQIGVLGWMILARAAILRDGTEIMLLTQPVDPRDLLRGDYVSLDYNISSLPAELFAGEMPETGDAQTVHVRLRPDADGIWQPVAAAFDAPPAAPAANGEVDIRGTAPAIYGNGPVAVDYGIERFYVPEGEGRPIEEGIAERRFTMKVMVSEAGQAQIKALYDDGTLIFEEPIY